MAPEDEPGLRLPGLESEGAMNLIGRRFGELVVIAKAPPRPRQSTDRRPLEQWLCECDCGRQAIRTTSRLRRAEKMGEAPACRECNIERSRGQLATSRDARRSALASHFVQYGSFWSTAGLLSEINKLRDAVAAELGFYPDLSPIEMPIVDWEYSERTHGGQRMAFFIPLSDSGRWWRCDACGFGFQRGFGCSACGDLVCRECARLQLHGCRRSARTAYRPDDLLAWTERFWAAGQSKPIATEQLDDELRRKVVEARRRAHPDPESHYDERLAQLQAQLEKRRRRERANAQRARSAAHRATMKANKAAGRTGARLVFGDLEQEDSSI